MVRFTWYCACFGIIESWIIWISSHNGTGKCIQWDELIAPNHDTRNSSYNNKELSPLILNIFSSISVLQYLRLRYSGTLLSSEIHMSPLHCSLFCWNTINPSGSFNLMILQLFRIQQTLLERMMSLESQYSMSLEKLNSNTVPLISDLAPSPIHYRHWYQDNELNMDAVKCRKNKDGINS